MKYPNDDDNKMKYLEWVNHVLIKGTIAVSPSAIVGYALEEQRFSEGGLFERNQSGGNIENNEEIKNGIEEVGNENEYKELIDMSYVKLVNGMERMKCKWNYMFIIILVCVIV